MRFILLVAIALLAPGFAWCAPVAAPTLATMASTQQFDFRSAINGESYRIQVFIPHQAPPPSGYPVLYVLDGDALFGTFAEAVRNRSLAGEIEPAIVVGIAGGPGDKTADRTFDFTPSDLSQKEKTIIKEFGDDAKFGGYERFFKVIQEEVKPRVAAAAPIDGKRSAIFGWSLGGQFVVRTLLRHPEAFNTYLALSPSLWWNNRSIFAEIPAFEQNTLKNHIQTRLYLGVGSLEGIAPSGLLSDSLSHEQLAAELRYGRMVGNMNELAEALQPFYARNNMAFTAHVFEGDSHNSVPWTALNPVLNFALLVNSSPNR